MKNQSRTPHLQPRQVDASAVILAGGKSSRMGQAKALLAFDGEPLIVHTVRRLAQLFPDIVVVAAPEQELPALSVTLVHDAVGYQGPVGGICYGLRAAQRDVCFVTSCDAPFLQPALMTYLVSRSPGYDVVVPFWQDRLQPLLAVYRRSVVPLLQGQLERGELRPILLYKKVPTCEVGPDEIRQFDPDGYSFRNMNSPQDYQAGLELWQTLYHTGASLSQNELSCTIELFGVARLKAKTARVSLTLSAGADLGDALCALAEAVPALVGPVLTHDRHKLVQLVRLVPGFACNVNGQTFVRDMRTAVQAGDSILILSSDAGG
jgi:molybdopterin-guanine dinucleotide biosynthesis protein A/molybdopterin converting factor small subunit